MVRGMKLGFKTHFISIVTSIIGATIAAFFFRDMWAWFVVPLGAPVLALPHAYGLSLFARTLARHDPSGTTAVLVGAAEERESTAKERLFYVAYYFTVNVLTPAFAYLLGYLAHTCR